ncbi:MAG: SURF1 family protein [Legionellaceae bacterium]|nr:SURF1 family protein [Legionellaceae bacterium]
MNPSISRFRYRFTPHWTMCVLACVFITLFIALGVWQLHRAEEKRLILARQEAFEHQAPRIWQGEGAQPEAFESVRIQGKFMPQVIFLDNQLHAHQVGYHVISPLEIGADRVLLIDRGWVPAGVTRSELPNINTPTEQLTLQGRAYYSLGKPWLLGPGIEIKQVDRAVIESLDLQLMEQFLHKSVYPFIIRLDAQSPAGYVRSWPAVSMPPVRHLGYAFQWFAFALVLLIIFIALNIRKYEKNNSN